jgi:hypothetical protein
MIDRAVQTPRGEHLREDTHIALHNGCVDTSRIGQEGRPVSAEAARVDLISKIGTVLSYVILTAGLLSIVVAGYLVFVSHTRVPIWDEWGPIDSLVTAARPLPLSWFWSQHNEHRIVFERLLLLADFHFFHGNHWIFFAVMFATQIEFVVLLAWLLRVIGGLQGVVWRSAVGLIAYCSFCPSQEENLGWAFQVSFLLPGFFVMLVLVGLLLYQRSAERASVRPAYLGLSIFAAVAATCSNSNGVLAWPVVILVTIALRLSRRITATYVVVGTIMVAAYLYRYTSPGNHASPVASLGHPLVLVEYMAKYFGGSFLRREHYLVHSHLPVILGAAGLVTGLVVAVWILWCSDLRKPGAVAVVALMSYSVGTAFITALGRINFGTDQAFASRYQTFALLFWSSLALLLLMIAKEACKPATMNILLAVIAVIMLQSATSYRFPLREASGRALRAEVAGLGLMTGVRDPQTVREVLYPWPEVVWRDTQYLRQRGLMLFSTELYRQLNTPLLERYRIGSEDQCLGQVDAVKRLKTGDSDGLRIAGWAVDRSTHLPASRIVAAEDGRITGFALTGFWRPELRTLLQSKRALYAGFQGYVGNASRTGMVDVYAVLENTSGEVCHIASLLPPVQ